MLGLKQKDPGFPAEQTFFASEDVGNLVMVAGIGRLKSGHNNKAAIRFVDYVLSPKSQQYFTDKVFEYPMARSVKANAKLVSLKELERRAPSVQLDLLDDRQGTQALLRKVGLQ